MLEKNKERLTRGIHEFVWGEMDWQSAFELWNGVSESQQWIDYLLLVIELHECDILSQ